MEVEKLNKIADWILSLPKDEQFKISPLDFLKLANMLEKYKTEQLFIPRVSNCATSMEEILNEAQRRKAKHSVQYSDYSLDTWTVANDLLEHRKNALLADGSVRKVRIEYEM